MQPLDAWLKPKSVAIYLFHGVIEAPWPGIRNYTQKHITAARFRTILDKLCAQGTPLSMDDVIAHHQQKRPFPDNSFVITFDDGFLNNYTVAAPILREYQVPATFYVASQFIDENGMSWIDQVEYLLETTTAGELRLPWQSAPTPFSTDADKIALLTEVRRYIKSTPNYDIPAFVANTYAQLDRPLVCALDDVLNQKMTWSEVAQLAAEPLFTVGGHSHTHPILAFLDDNQLNTEITRSIQLLNEKAGIQSPHYSYPEGLAHCYDARVISLLKAHDIICSPSAIEGHNDEQTDLFHLRRIMAA